MERVIIGQYIRHVKRISRGVTIEGEKLNVKFVAIWDCKWTKKILHPHLRPVWAHQALYYLLVGLLLLRPALEYHLLSCPHHYSIILLLMARPQPLSHYLHLLLIKLIMAI